MEKKDKHEKKPVEAGLNERTTVRLLEINGETLTELKLKELYERVNKKNLLPPERRRRTKLRSLA